jgi:hypothetical protein
LSKGDWPGWFYESLWSPDYCRLVGKARLFVGHVFLSTSLMDVSRLDCTRMEKALGARG